MGLNKEALNQQIQLLKSRLAKLKEWKDSLTIIIKQFERLTIDCIQRISSANIMHIDHYVRAWFKLYLGAKDECLVLCSGQIQRKYHYAMHKLYLHQRDHESTYYKKSQLSGCSCDGIDYDFRKLSKGNENNSKLNQIADENETLSKEVDSYNKRVDSCLFQVNDTIKRLKDVEKVDVSCRPNAEYIKIFYRNNLPDLKILRLDIEDCTREEALSTLIEDPIEAVTKGVTVQEVPQNDVESKSRVRVTTILDSDDEGEDLQYLLTQKRQFESKTLDFGTSSISLKVLKKSYGVDEDEIDKYDSDGNLVHDEDGTVLNEKPTKLKAEKHVIDKEVGLSRDGIQEETCNIIDDSLLFYGLPQPKQNILIIHILHPITSVLLTTTKICYEFNDEIIKEESEVNLKVEEILNLVSYRLWCKSKALIAQAIQLEDMSIVKEGNFPIGQLQSKTLLVDGHKPILIRCYFNEIIQKFTQSVIDNVFHKENYKYDGDSRRAMFVFMRGLTESCQQTNNLLDLSDMSTSLIDFFDIFKLLVKQLLDVNSNCPMSVLLKRSFIDVRVISFLFENFIEVSFHNCLTNTILIQVCERMKMKNGSLRLLRKLDIRYNRSFVYVDLHELRMSNSMKDIRLENVKNHYDNNTIIHYQWLIAIRELLCCVNVEEFDISYVFESEDEGLILFYGLLYALFHHHYDSDKRTKIICKDVINRFERVIIAFITEMKLFFPNIVLEFT